jgi:hypothetical protein
MPTTTRSADQTQNRQVRRSRELAVITRRGKSPISTSISIDMSASRTWFGPGGKSAFVIAGAAPAAPLLRAFANRLRDNYATVQKSLLVRRHSFAERFRFVPLLNHRCPGEPRESRKRLLKTLNEV